MQRILIIDDNSAALQAYSELFSVREPAIDVTTAASAEAALELMDAASFDVVICDVRLPGMDGLGFVRESRERGRDPLVVLVTGYGTIELEEEAAQHGVYAVLHKPVDPQAFLSVVKRALLRTWLRRLPGSGFALEPERIYQVRIGPVEVMPLQSGPPRRRRRAPTHQAGS
jgi:DNA-binding NtrC family response regulator